MRSLYPSSLLQRSVHGSPPVRIEGYHGSLVVNGQRFEHDIIIHADGGVTGRNCGCTPELRAEVDPSYSGDYFHIPLTEMELGFLEEERPEFVIVGAGFRSMLPITPRAKEMLSKYPHRVVSTPLAMELINAERRRFVAIIHSSC